MGIEKEQLKKRIAVASKDLLADLVIKNGQIIDVFNLEIIKGDIAIADGIIVGIGKFEGKQVIDAKSRYISPGFIDGHVHIESAMLTPSEYAKVVLPHGVTTVIADPHEIGNVAGIDGLKFMIENSKDIPLDVYFMLPSSVPATPFESSGAKLEARDLEPFYKEKRVLGLAEVMDYPSLISLDDILIDKIAMTSRYTNQIDGHLAGLKTNDINVFRSLGITTDHECDTASAAKERLRRGMHLIIREGSAAKNLKELIKVVNTSNSRRCLFCTDDKHLDDLYEEGSIDHNVRLAIQYGCEPHIAIQMATINAAECYGLKNKGAIAPGFDADLLFLDDLKSINIEMVIKAGKVIARHGYDDIQYSEKTILTNRLTSSLQLPDIQIKNLQIPIGKTRMANIIQINPNQLITTKLIEEVDVRDSNFTISIKKDQLKLVVVERHKKTGNIGLGVVKGFGLIEGAIATTVAHDSHNIVAIGTNDNDIIKGIKVLKEMNGGLVLIKGGKIIASFPLPIAGLMSDEEYTSAYHELKKLKNALDELGFNDTFNPFLALSFLTLPVIPDLKLTDKGLFDVVKGEHIEVSI